MSLRKHIGGPRQTSAQRNEIIELYLVDPEAANRLAVSRGLAPDYAYKVANGSGRLPLKIEIGRSHIANLARAV